MVKIGWREDSEIELLNADSRIFEGSKKVGVHRRKTSGKTYESPRIVLPRGFKKFIGKKFRTYQGKANYTFGDTGQEGNYILLFFPDAWNKEES